MSFGREMKDFVSSFTSSYKMFNDAEEGQARRDYYKSLSGAPGEGDDRFNQFFGSGQQAKGGTGSGTNGSGTSGGGAYGGGGRAHIPSAEQQKLATTYTDYLVQKGYTPEAATGIVANAWHESAGFQPWIGGDHKDGQPQSFGLFQFNRKGELPGLEKFAAANKRDIKDPYTQLDYVDSRMRETGLFDKLNGLKDPNATTKLFSDAYERPSNPLMNSRLGYAQTLWGLYSKGASGSATAGGAPATGAPQPPQATREPQPLTGGKKQDWVPGGDTMAMGAPQGGPAVGGDDEEMWAPTQFAAAGGTVERVDGPAVGDEDRIAAMEAQIARMEAMNRAQQRYEGQTRSQFATNMGNFNTLFNARSGAQDPMQVQARAMQMAQSSGLPLQGYQNREMAAWAKQYPAYAQASPFGFQFKTPAASPRPTTPAVQAPTQTAAQQGMASADWRQWTGGPGTKNAYARGGMVEPDVPLDEEGNPLPADVPRGNYRLERDVRADTARPLVVGEDETFDPNDPRLQDDGSATQFSTEPRRAPRDAQAPISVTRFMDPPMEAPAVGAGDVVAANAGRGGADVDTQVGYPRNAPEPGAAEIAGRNPGRGTSRGDDRPNIDLPEEGPAVGAEDVVGINPGRGRSRGAVPPAEGEEPKVAAKGNPKGNKVAAAADKPARGARAVSAPAVGEGEVGAVDNSANLVSKAEIEANNMTPQEVAQLQGARAQARRIQANAGADPDKAFAPTDAQGNSQVKVGDTLVARNAGIGSGLKAIASMFGLNSQGAVGDHAGVSQFAASKNAMPPQQYNEIARTVDPEGTMTEGQRNEAIIAELHKHGQATGRPEEAAQAIGQVMLNQRQQVQFHGALAEHLMAQGDMKGAIRALQEGYDAIPDGNTVVVDEAQDGTPVFRQLDDHNRVVSEGAITPEAVKAQIALAKSGRAYDQMVIRTASGGGAGGPGGGQAAGPAVPTTEAAGAAPGNPEGNARQSLPRTYSDIEPRPTMPPGYLSGLSRPAAEHARKRFETEVLDPWKQRAADWTTAHREDVRDERAAQRDEKRDERQRLMFEQQQTLQNQRFEQQEKMRREADKQRDELTARTEQFRQTQESAREKARLEAQQRQLEQQRNAPDNDVSGMKDGQLDQFKTALTQSLTRAYLDDKGQPRTIQNGTPDGMVADEAGLAQMYKPQTRELLTDTAIQIARWNRGMAAERAADVAVTMLSAQGQGVAGQLGKANAGAAYRTQDDPSLGKEATWVDFGGGNRFVMPKAVVERIDTLRGTIAQDLRRSAEQYNSDKNKQYDKAGVKKNAMDRLRARNHDRMMNDATGARPGGSGLVPAVDPNED